jgi:hypothetical protein
MLSEEDGILKLNRNLNEGGWKRALSRRRRRRRKKGSLTGF